MAASRVLVTLLALVLLLASSAAGVRAQACPSYGPARNGLLFGGAAAPGVCRSGCQSRSSEWAKICSGEAGAWGTCSPQQTQRTVDLARSIAGGAMLRLSPCDLVPYLRGRTLWLLGDSFTKQTYRALQCFLIDFWNHQECETSPDAAEVQALMKQPVQPGRSKCFHLLGPQGGRVCFAHAVLGTSLVGNGQVASGGVLPLLRQKFASPQDIFVVNFGFWHRKNPADWSAFQPALHALGKFHQTTRAQWPHTLFMETPAEHPADAASKTCAPITGYSFDPSNGQLTRRNVQVERSGAASRAWNLEGAWANTNVPPRAILPSYGLPLVPAFNPSVPLFGAHVGMRQSPTGRPDCMHYCHPGVPEMGVWQLFNAFRSGATGVRPLPAGTRQSHRCVPSTTAGFKV